MHVETHHQIVTRGQDMMLLTEFMKPDRVIVTAERVQGQWVVKADGADDVTAFNRGDAITAMTEVAVSILPEGGYSTTVPHGLRKLP